MKSPQRFLCLANSTSNRSEQISAPTNDNQNSFSYVGDYGDNTFNPSNPTLHQSFTANIEQNTTSLPSPSETLDFGGGP